MVNPDYFVTTIDDGTFKVLVAAVLSAGRGGQSGNKVSKKKRALLKNVHFIVSV